jgi:hypothetical protein
MTLACLLAACGGGGSGSSKQAAAAAPPIATTAPSETTTIALPKPPPDPCGLVSKADAEAIVGIALQPGVKAGTPEDLLCQYTSSPNGPTAQVEVFVGDGAKKALDIDKDELHHTFSTLAGVGDEAWLEPDQVFARKGSLWVSVNVVALDAPADQVQKGLQTLISKMVGQL